MSSSRNIVAARQTLIHLLISPLRDHGMPDLLTVRASASLSLTTDFETTFRISLCQSLCNVCRPNDNMSFYGMEYVQALCLNCNVHAKRIGPEKVNIKEDYMLLYNWAVSTRLCNTHTEVYNFLTETYVKGGQFASFAPWLNCNAVANVLWFPCLHNE